MNEQIEGFDGTNNFYSNNHQFTFNKTKVMNKEIEDILAEYGYVNMDYDTRRALILIILEYSSRQLKKKDEEIEKIFKICELRRKEIDKQIIELGKQDAEIERLKGLIGLQQNLIRVMDIPTNHSDTENIAFKMYRERNAELQQFKTENNI